MLTRINAGESIGLHRQGHWCTIARCDIHNSTNTSNVSSGLQGAYNASKDLDSDCSNPTIHFCVRVLHDTIHDTNVRYFDIAIIIPTFLYFVFLTWCLLHQWKVIGKRPLCAVLFTFVYMVTICGLVCKAIAMTKSYKVEAYKVCALLLRGFILVSEISVVTFGLFFRFYGRSKIALLLTVVLIIIVGITFTTTEGVLEFKKLRELPCSSYNFFTHGGMIFLFCTSVIFCIAYFGTFLVYLFRLHKKFSLPSRQSFYYYALILSVINAIQAVGSMLWYKGLKEQQMGQSGICMVTLTTIIYEITYVPMTYWIFLRNFLRSKSTSNSTAIDLQDTRPFSPTNGLVSKAKRFLRSTSHNNYGTNALWNTNDEEEDSDDESGLYSSGASNFTIS